MSDDPRVLFGRRLAQLRRKKGWSQEAVALESDLDRSFVGSVERGHRNISLANICKLAKTLGVPPEEMMKFSDE